MPPVKLSPGASVAHFSLDKVLGSGSYGQVYKGKNQRTGAPVAVKLESPDTRPHLEDESKIYTILDGGLSLGIPRMHWFGREKQYNVMVLDLLGPSLESLLNQFSRHLSLKTVLMIADQTISAIEFMHERKIIHRDVKPANMVSGIGPVRDQIFFVDFGLAKYYVDKKTGEHIPYREGKSLTGTARYASVATHAGVEQSRRDDLESLGYIYLYLLTGTLPWQGMQEPKAKTKKEKYQKIHDWKAVTTPDSLCEGWPSEFAAYLTYVKGLSFTEDPDYAYMKALFRNLYRRQGFAYDGRYDWTEDDDDLNIETEGSNSEDNDRGHTAELYEYSQDVESRSYAGSSDTY